jgi:hypothetical protein
MNDPIISMKTMDKATNLFSRDENIWLPILGGW